MTSPPSKISRSVIPALASIAIHAALFAALLSITIERFTSPPPRAARLSLESTSPDLPRAAQQDEPREDVPASTPKARPTNTPIATTREAVADAEEQMASRAARPAPQRTAARPPAPVIPAATPVPAVTFAGSEAQAATRIVFAVDASGAMVTSFSFIQDELARAIDRLQPTQSFQIILFGERANPATGEPVPVRAIPHTGRARDLIRATAGNRTLAQRWINRALPGGKSNPVVGLTAALDFDPDLIFLLARGIQRTGAIPDPSDTQSVLSTLDAGNPIDPRTGLRPAVIKAIEFVEPDPTGLIERIARAHGDGEGSLRLITPENTADPEPTPAPTAEQPSETTNRSDTAARALAKLESDAADLAVLVGAATPDESDRVRTAATAALQALADIPPATRRTNDPRPNLLRARANLLRAMAEPESPLRSDLAARALADALPLRITDPATAAARDTIAARARILLAQPAAAHETLLALLRTADPGDPNLDPKRRAPLEAALVRARIALLDAATSMGPASPEAARARDAMAKALGARPTNDTITHALAATSLASSRLAAGDPVAEALAPLTSIYSDTARPADERRALAAPRLDSLVRANSIPMDQLPLTALRASADYAGWAPSTPAQHARAADLLEQLAEASPDQAERANATRDAAFHARSATQLERARELSFRLATDHPDHPDASAALTLALGNDPTTADLVRALETDPDHPRADDWRVAIAEQQRGSAALDLLGSISAPTLATSALVLELIDEILPSAQTESERAALLARAASEATRMGDDLDPRRRLLLARTLAASDPDAAVRTLDALPPDLSMSADADRVRLDAAATQADSAQTFAVARSIAERRNPDDGELYWRAVTLWLELGARHGGPDAAAAARAHIAGLRQAHPALGGEPWRSRLNAIAG